jgi:hypothetical protein
MEKFLETSMYFNENPSKFKQAKEHKAMKRDNK